MVNNLVRPAAVVLQDVVLSCTRCNCNLLCNGKNVLQILIRQFMSHLGMILGDDKTVTRSTRTNVCRKLSHTTLKRTQKSITLVRLSKFHGRDLAVNDLAKDAVSVLSHLGCSKKQSRCCLQNCYVVTGPCQVGTINDYSTSVHKPRVLEIVPTISSDGTQSVFVANNANDYVIRRDGSYTS